MWNMARCGSGDRGKPVASKTSLNSAIGATPDACVALTTTIARWTSANATRGAQGRMTASAGALTPSPLRIMRIQSGCGPNVATLKSVVTSAFDPSATSAVVASAAAASRVGGAAAAPRRPVAATRDGRGATSAAATPMKHASARSCIVGLRQRTPGVATAHAGARRGRCVRPLELSRHHVEFGTMGLNISLILQSIEK